MAQRISQAGKLPITEVFQPVVTTSEEITAERRKANNDPQCIGLMTWMHTSSPAKMWIAGLKILSKPFAHLHTQYNRVPPRSEIDMEFMNLNHPAHGDREFGFIGSRMKSLQKRCAGHISATLMNTGKSRGVLLSL